MTLLQKFLFFFIIAGSLSLTSKGQVHANFNALPVQGCAPLTVNFSNLSTGTGTLTCTWYFGNGNTSALYNPSANYINPGTYTVKLIVSNGSSKDSLIKTDYITVFANPTANFAGVAPLAGCIPFNVLFNDSSTPGDGAINHWTWYFGDGDTSTLHNPTHVYTHTGTYAVSLHVTDVHTCHDDIVFQNYVVTSDKPTVNFVANNTSSCSVPFTVTFANSSTGFGPLTYHWSFGDGAIDSIQNPSHTYTVAGLYTVTLTATDQYGCNQTTVLTNYISITPVVPAFHFLPGDSVCIMQTVNFFSDADTTVLWDFGDPASGSNTSTLLNPSHSYAASGTYYITLVAAPNTPCQINGIDTIVVRSAPAAVFTQSTYYLCSSTMPVTYNGPNAANWSWSFPGGTPSASTLQNPIVTYSNEGNYTATLTITDSHGCTGTYTNSSTPVIVDFPNAAFAWSGPQNHCVPYPVTFTDGSTCNSADNITGWNWNFGDPTSGSNNTSTLNNPLHIYNTPGEYTITLTVTTASGCTATATQTIKVGSHQHPQISFTYTGGCANDDSIQFTSLSTDASLIDHWYWNFLNDTTGAPVASSTDQNPLINFHGNDTINIQYVIEYLECKDTLWDSAAFVLHGPFLQGLSPVYNCTNPLHVGIAISFIKEATRWYWDYNGDGIYDDSIKLIHPTYVYNDTVWHNYPSRGNYMVHLKAYNDSTGCYYEDSIPIKVLVIHAQISAQSPHCYNGNVFDLTGSVDWNNPNTTINYGDGQTVSYSSLDPFNPVTTHDYPNVFGTYTITLIMQNSWGCRDTAYTSVTIFHPVAGFTVSPIIGCGPLTVTLNDTSHSQTPLTYTWFSGGIGSITTTNPSVSFTYINPQIWQPSLLITDSIGCTAIVNGTPVDLIELQPTISSIDNTICVNGSVQFSSLVQYADTYIWNFGDGSTWDTIMNPVHQYTAPGKYTVSLIVRNSYPNCVDTLVLNQYVDVQTIDAQFTVTSATADCYPFPVQITNLTDTTFHPVTWNWTFGDGGVGTQFTPFHNYTMPGNYWLTLEAITPNGIGVPVPNGCTDKDSILISVTGPYANIVVSDSIICKGDTVTFHLINSTGISSVTWDFGDGNTSSNPSLTVTHIYNTVPPSGGYGPSLIYCSGPNCCLPNSADSVYVYQVMANFTINGDTITSMCNPGSVNFTNTSLGPITSYNWYLGDGNVSSGFEPASPYTYNNATTHDSTYYISLAITSTLGGCYDSIVKPFTVYPQPHITVGNNAAICLGSSIQLSALGGDSIAWTPTSSLSNPSVYNPTATPTSTTSYQAVIYDSRGCSNTGSVNVFVQQMPLLNHSADTTIIIGEFVNMLASSDQTGITYQWSPSTALSCTNCPNPIAQPLQNTTYTVVITDTMNCFQIQGQINIEVREEFSLDVPSAFTPNGDGNNDIVFVRGWGIKKLIEFNIYNRWGECIFSTDDLLKGWDGTFKGIKQDVDSYAYTVKVLSYGGKELTKNGLINLLR